MIIRIAPYDPEWVQSFEREKHEILKRFGDNAKAVEHVGSTSIPGQPAKPVVDIFIGVEPLRELEFYQSALGGGEYRYIETGMAGRYVFSKYTGGVWTHNLHVMLFSGDFYLKNEFLFRDYLREHPELVIEYAEVKMQIAEGQPETMQEYTKAKTAFIQKVVGIARAEKGLPPQNVWED